ncbi:MAG: SDR family oxidoreductase [Acidobacteriota bacterium]
MANVLVTGGAGFIGSNLCQALVERGERVRVLDDLSTGKLSNLAAVEGRVTFIRGSVSDAEAVKLGVAGVDVVFHLGAIPSVARSVADPVSTDRANILGTLQVLLAARDAGVRRVVFASSSSVYGETETLPKIETMTPEPASPYALSKLAGEHYCAIFSKLYGLSTVALRFFNIFGPRQDPSSQYSGVIAIFISKILQGSRATIHGDGEQSRDFTYVDNAIATILAAAESQEGNGDAINVGCGERHSVNELYQTIREIGGSPIEPIYGPARAGDVRHSQADLTRARIMLGYEPAVTFEEGLRRTFEYYERQGAG